MRLAACLLILVLSACASTYVPAPVAPRKVGEEPPLHTRTSRSVGDVVYETYNYQQVVAARLKSSVAIDVLAAKAMIPSGSLLESFRDGAVSAYCTRDLALVVSMSGPMSRVCLADMNRNGSFESWKAPQGPLARQMWAKLDHEVPFAPEEDIDAATGGFRYELLYQGISGAVVSLLYREFLDNLARPAFQQDLTYTLEQPGPTEVSFRGTRLRIYGANNNQIEYEVLTGLR